MEYTVDLGAQVGALTGDELLGDRLLTALEHDPRVAGAATLQDSETGVVSARFCVQAVDAEQAWAVGAAAFRAALQEAGVQGQPNLTEILVEEYHEEAAAAG